MPSTLVKDALDEVLRRVGKSIDEIKVKELVVSVLYTAVRLSSDDIGFASTPISDLPSESREFFSRAGTLTDIPVGELAAMAQSWDFSERVIGVAALNALSQLAVRTRGDDIVRSYGDVVDMVKVGKGDTVVVVGNMRHSVEKLRTRAKRVMVLERSVGLRDEGSYPDTAAEEVIPKGDLVFITGATLCNGTIDRILKLSGSAREVVLLGATAGIFPPSLFEKGGTAVATMEILDAGEGDESDIPGRREAGADQERPPRGLQAPQETRSCRHQKLKTASACSIFCLSSSREATPNPPSSSDSDIPSSSSDSLSDVEQVARCVLREQLKEVLGVGPVDPLERAHDALPDVGDGDVVLVGPTEDPERHPETLDVVGRADRRPEDRDEDLLAQSMTPRGS